MKRLLVVILMISILLVGGASSVAAAPPEHNKHYDVITLECGNESYTVVSHARSQTVAFHSVDSRDVFILVSFEVVDASSGEFLTIQVGQGNRTGQQGTLLTCETPKLQTLRATFLRVP